jgi:MFS family permease
MMGECETVQTYAAAQVFYWTGMNGMTYVLDIFIADTSLLKNRLIWIAITGSPYVCNTFAGPELGQRFLMSSSWRWGYRTFAIITPFVCMPFWGIFFLMSRRAEKVGVIQRQKSDRTIFQSAVHWCVEFDGERASHSLNLPASSNSVLVIGLLLICGGFSLFLLPFSLATYQKQGWASPMIICMIIAGLLLNVAFALWEHYWAPKTFFPFHLMKDRSIVAACFLGCNSWIAF